MDRRSSLKLIGGTVAGATLDGIWRSARAARPDTRPDILVVVVDDLRWDEYGAGGHPYLKTPNIDRLALEGASFARAFHATPLCSPNRACILTGQYTARHCIYNNEDQPTNHGLIDRLRSDLGRLVQQSISL